MISYKASKQQEWSLFFVFVFVWMSGIYFTNILQFPKANQKHCKQKFNISHGFPFIHLVAYISVIMLGCLPQKCHTIREKAPCNICVKNSHKLCLCVSLSSQNINLFLAWCSQQLGLRLNYLSIRDHLPDVHGMCRCGCMCSGWGVMWNVPEAGLPPALPTHVGRFQHLCINRKCLIFLKARMSSRPTAHNPLNGPAKVFSVFTF